MWRQREPGTFQWSLHLSDTQVSLSSLLLSPSLSLKIVGVSGLARGAVLLTTVPLMVTAVIKVSADRSSPQQCPGTASQAAEQRNNQGFIFLEIQKNATAILVSLATIAS